MRNRIPPSERIKREIRAVLEGHQTGEHPLDRLVRSGAQYLLQKVLEELEKGRADQSGPTLPDRDRLSAPNVRHSSQSVGELAWCTDDTGDTAGSGQASSTTDRTTRKGAGSSLKKSSKEGLRRRIYRRIGT